LMARIGMLVAYGTLRWRIRQPRLSFLLARGRRSGRLHRPWSVRTADDGRSCKQTRDGEDVFTAGCGRFRYDYAERASVQGVSRNILAPADHVQQHLATTF